MQLPVSSCTDSNAYITNKQNQQMILNSFNSELFLHEYTAHKHNHCNDHFNIPNLNKSADGRINVHGNFGNC